MMLYANGRCPEGEVHTGVLAVAASLCSLVPSSLPRALTRVLWGGRQPS